MTQPDIAFIEIADRQIAVRHRAGASPTLLFLPGYASDMDGAKAMAVDAFAATRGLACLRLDYSGTGSSSGEFADATLDQWIAEAIAVLDQLTEGPIVVIGSSMGGWIGLHLALRLPDRVTALVGIAAAPDFTQWGFTETQMQVIAKEGLLEEDNPYGPEPSRVYRDFWQSGQELRLLEDPIAIDCPVRLIHGEDDPDVPLDIANRLMRQLRSADVQLTIIKGSRHRLSEPHEIGAILAVLAGLLETFR
ncbi:MAG: alpha/beta hydrolase [Sphingomicrobium sp.]